MSARATPATVVYDGACGFCSTTARRLKRLDREGRLRFCRLQDPDVYTRFPQLDPGATAEALHVVDEHGRVHVGGDALREAFARVGAPSIVAVLGLPVARHVTELAYRLVAANRSRIPL